MDARRAGREASTLLSARRSVRHGPGNRPCESVRQLRSGALESAPGPERPNG